MKARAWSRKNYATKYFSFFKGLVGLALKLGANVLKTDDVSEVKTLLENNISELDLDVKGIEVECYYLIIIALLI